MTPPRKTSKEVLPKPYVPMAKLGALRGMNTDLIDLDSADAPAIVAFLNVYHAADLIVKAVERDLSASNLSVARYAILRMLSGREPVTLGWIAEKHFTRLSNITAMIDRLERDGLVKRMADSTDRRVVRVTTTPEGEALLRKTRGPHRSFIAKTMAPLDAEQLQTLSSLLSELSRPFEQADTVVTEVPEAAPRQRKTPARAKAKSV